MKTSELESKIRAMRVPERGEDYWEAFPELVLKESRRERLVRMERAIMPGIFWACRLALTCVVIGFCLWQSEIPKTFAQAVRKDQKQLRQSVARIQTNLGHFMQDEHGLHYLIKDQP